MNRNEKIIISLVEKILNIDLSDHVEINLINNGMDSIKVIQLLVLLEESFGIEFADEDLQMKYFISVNEITKLVTNKINNKGN